MALRFVLCVALERAYFPRGHIDRQLLQQANRWLARRLQGYDDRLLVVGRHFTTDQELLEVLVPYGLESADRRLADPDEENDGESIGATVSSWLQSAHSSAVPALLAGTAAGSGGYGTEGWWWTGIEAADDSSEAVADILLATTSPTFKRQAATWAAILEEDYDSDSGDEYAEHELRLLALTLARWLTGSDAACENTFFDFDYAGGASVAELSGLRLGYELGAFSLRIPMKPPKQHCLLWRPGPVLRSGPVPSGRSCRMPLGATRSCFGRCTCPSGPG